MMRRGLLLAFACETIVAMGCATAAGRPVEFEYVAAECSATFTQAAVAADHPFASEAGARMLAQGGNAVDAAVATSFALSVVRPYSCGIGGGGFMIIAFPKDSDEARNGRRFVAVNYRETCPKAIDRDSFMSLDDDDASRFGVHAVAVPGTVAGLMHVLERYGTLDRATVLGPAIEAAAHGFIGDAHCVNAIEQLREMRETHPEARETTAYLWHDVFRAGRVQAGDVVRNPAQAVALRMIAKQGADGFYRSEIADAIVEAMRERGGAITRDDLASYKIVEREPLIGDAFGRTIISMPPPSSGGIAALQIMELVERRWSDLLGLHDGALTRTSPAYVHLMVEAMKHAFADRAEWLADDAFVEVPTVNLLSDAYLDDLVSRIDLSRTLPTKDYGSRAPAPIDGGTSHFCVVDANGMAVACTETINLEFGSLVEVPGFGFALNNEMDDFTTRPAEANAFGLRQSERNLPEPGKRPLSSMTPMIVLDRNGDVLVVAGASGGPRIITSTVQCVLAVLLFEQSPEAALREARFHHQWLPERLVVEEWWTDAESLAALRNAGHDIDLRGDLGHVQLIRRSADGLSAASDPRKGGRPAGF